MKKHLTHLDFIDKEKSSNYQSIVTTFRRTRILRKAFKKGGKELMEKVASEMISREINPERTK